MIVNKYKMLYFVITIFTTVGLCLYKLNINNGYFVIALMCTLELLFFLIINKKITGETLNFSAFFVILLFVFHFGQVILLGLFPEFTNNQQITLDYFSKSECIDAMKILNLCFVAVCLGIVIMSKRKYSVGVNDSFEIAKFDFELYRKKALLMIMLTFPVKLCIDLVFWYLAITGGERIGVVWLSTFPNFIVAYGNLSIIGFCLYIISLHNDSKKQLKALVIIIGYFLLLMLSGRRSENVVYICILAFFYIKTYKKKIGFMKIIILGLIAYLFMNFLFTIVYSRAQVGAQAISSFTDTFNMVLKDKNIFVEALREYGNTGYTAVCVVALWLKSYSPTYGLSLLYSCTAILPNIGGGPGRLTDLGNFTIQLKNYGMVTDLYKNIGGSLFGELLFNFGIWGGIFAAFLLGLVISLINKKSQIKLAKFEYIKLAYYIPAMVAILYWVRDVFGGGIRTVVWGMLFIYISKRIYSGKIK